MQSKESRFGKWTLFEGFFLYLMKPTSTSTVAPITLSILFHALLYYVTIRNDKDQYRGNIKGYYTINIDHD